MLCGCGYTPGGEEQAFGPDTRGGTGPAIPNQYQSQAGPPGEEPPFPPTRILQIFFSELTSFLQLNHTMKRETFLEPHEATFLLWPFASAELPSICLLAFRVLLFDSYDTDASMQLTVRVGGTHCHAQDPDGIAHSATQKHLCSCCDV